MGCCGKKNIVIPRDQQQIVDKLHESKDIRNVVKSNRSPRGSLARQCLNCGTKTIANVCPVCFFPLK